METHKVDTELQATSNLHFAQYSWRYARVKVYDDNVIKGCLQMFTTLSHALANNFVKRFIS